MRPPRSERTLRRLVAQLANAPAEDIEAIVSELEGPQRARVLDLMAGYRGQAPLPVEATRSHPLDTDGLSGWLTACVLGQGEAITAATAQALRDAVAASEAPRLERVAATPGSWLGRLAQLANGGAR